MQLGVCVPEGSAQHVSSIVSRGAASAGGIPSCHSAVKSGTFSAGVTLCTGNKLEVSSPGLEQLYSAGKFMDQTPPESKSCFRTRHVSVTRREVIHCCLCWCLGEALPGVQALPAAGVHVGVCVQAPGPAGQEEKLFPLVLK